MLFATAAVAAWGIWMILQPDVFVGTGRRRFREPEHAQVFGIGIAVVFSILLVRGVMMYRTSRRS